MSKFLLDVYGADRVNQAVAVLGGATAPSYEAVSLHSAENFMETEPGLSPSGFDFFSEAHPQTANGEALHTGERSVSEPTLVLLRNANPPNGFVDDPITSEPSQLPTASQDPDLLTRFQSSETDNAVPLVVQPGDLRATGDGSGEPLVLSNGATSLSSFLEQLVAQVEGASGDLSTDLDGSRQSAVRELISEIGSELSGSVRTALQDNVAGVGRELVAQVIDQTGVHLLDSAVEPFLSTDYYAESAVLINGALDSLGQPIGSVALPHVGPFVANLRNELAGFSA